MAAAQVQLQPDIQYHPDYSKFLDRSKRRLERETLTKVLPPGLPQRLSSSFVWDGNEIQGRDDWVIALTDNHLEEVDRALSHFKELNKPSGYIDRTTFPLPGLGSLLREGSRELHFGRGFFVLRGIPVNKYTTEESIIIYAGISSYVGDLRGRQEKRSPTDGKAVVLSHIKDLTGIYNRENIGGPASTNDKQVFHTDSGDIVSLFCLQKAAEGGESQLASIWQVYNILAESRPDLIQTLTENWPFDGFNNPNQPYTARPLLYYQPASPLTPERLIIQYARRYFTGFLAQPRSSNIPPITEAQAEALDALHFLGEKHSVQLDFQKGDIQYVNNLAIFHARKGFSNAPNEERHLLRLWLRDSQYAWETPFQLQDRWDEIYKGLSEEEQRFPLEPTLRNVVSLVARLGLAHNTDSYDSGASRTLLVANQINHSTETSKPPFVDTSLAGQLPLAKADASIGTGDCAPIQNSFLSTEEGQRAVFVIGSAICVVGGLISWFRIPDMSHELEREDVRFKIYLEENGYRYEDGVIVSVQDKS